MSKAEFGVLSIYKHTIWWCTKMNASFRDLVSFDRPEPPSKLSLIQTLKSAASATTGALLWKQRALDAIEVEKVRAKLPPSNHTFRQYKLSLRSGWDASSVCAADYNFTDAFYPQFASTLSLCGIDVLALQLARANLKMFRIRPILGPSLF